jgi:hypothetical protein
MPEEGAASSSDVQSWSVRVCRQLLSSEESAAATPQRSSPGVSPSRSRI